MLATVLPTVSSVTMNARPDRLAAAVAHSEQTAKELPPRRRRGVKGTNSYPDVFGLRLPEGSLDRIEAAAIRDGKPSLAQWLRETIEDALRKSEQRAKRET